MNYEFLSDGEAIDYIDAMYDDGELYGTLIEDMHADGYLSDPGEPEHAPGGFSRAQDVADGLCETWNEIEMLPTRLEEVTN